ncbi:MULTISPECIES: DNA-directed DNA polymerase [Metallosphaera]|uniref:DNA-directed DNA polymerase n=1 Tax=Metallosphaera TaxID=41980 RepID=UPI001F05EB57|nr:DNA polymerase II [Metallosphaera sedula]MCH1770571.1 DNA polymerase II [Metallosphaera sedula]MCP6728769.1 DNA polymerase II [Metallosphaera sedula]
MRVDIFILDFSYDVEDGKPEIYIWGIDREGNRVVILEKSFRPYFYVTLKEDANVNEAITQIKRLSRDQSPITSVTEHEMKYFGRPQKVLRVETVIPALVRTYREEIAKLKPVKDVLEADIRFYMRYSIDTGVRPFYWLSAEVSQVERKDLRVAKVYELKRIERVYEDSPPQLRFMAFDIEVFNKYGFPNPRRDPIIVIGVWTDSGSKQFVNNDQDDLKILRDFSKFVVEYDPDVILGYNSNGFDWQYMLERASVRGTKLDIGRKVNSEPSQGTYGHYSVVGRLNVDLYGFAESLEGVKVKSLDNVADYLGILPKNKRTNLEWYQIPEYWEDPKRREVVLKYNLDDVKTTYLLRDVFFNFGEQLTVISGLPLDQLCMASVGHRVEWLLMRQAKQFNELIPNRVERRYEGYKGGLVIEPKPGLHENVAVLDFSSMYPSIMIKYNIGPDTLVQGECNDCWVAPEVGYKFRKDVDGFYRSILNFLLEERRKTKDQMSQAKDEYEKRRLDERQRALKIMANAMYGYMGWLGARWYSKEGAEAVTAWGRQTIMTAAEIAKNSGFEVIYGDTDSIFVKGDMSSVELLTQKIVQALDLDIKVDKKYKKVFFTENKKRYAGLTFDGKIDIVGFEAIRGDWCELAKDTQRMVIERILLKGVDDAVKAAKEVIMKVKRREFELHDIVIWKSLDKSLDEYEVDAPHVIAAKKAINAGYAIMRNGKIGYVVVKGAGRVSDRVEPYFMVKDKTKIDIDYYVEKQIIPAVMRILEPFGVKENNLKGGGIDIMDYFRDR